MGQDSTGLQAESHEQRRASPCAVAYMAPKERSSTRAVSSTHVPSVSQGMPVPRRLVAPIV